MIKITSLLLSLLFAMTSFSQQKDSLRVLLDLKTVPEKYKLEHFGLKAKVKTMEYHYGANQNDFLHYEFDSYGNLLHITNAAKQSKRSYFYDDKRKLKSYLYGKRTVDVVLDSSDNIINQIIHHQERDTKTIVNTYNKGGFWLSQKVVEDNQLMLENEYDKNNKLVKIKSYANGQLSSETLIGYVFYEKFIQVQHKSKYISSGNLSEKYFYLDYLGNDISGFNPEEKKFSEEKVKDVFSFFILDKEKNWIKAKTDYNTILHREFNYY